MKKAEIKVGSAYKVVHDHRGRAVVKGQAIVRPGIYSWSAHVSKWPVEFPDSVKDGEPERGEFESRMFLHEWREEDEQNFQREMIEGARSDDIREELISAGYEPYGVTLHIRDGFENLMLTFRGEVAHSVVDRLTERADD